MIYECEVFVPMLVAPSTFHRTTDAEDPDHYPDFLYLTGEELAWSMQTFRHGITRWAEFFASGARVTSEKVHLGTKLVDGQTKVRSGGPLCEYVQSRKITFRFEAPRRPTGADFEPWRLRWLVAATDDAPAAPPVARYEGRRVVHRPPLRRRTP